MKRCIAILLITSLLACQPRSGNEQVSRAYFGQLDSLLKRKDFFAARDLYDSVSGALTPFHRLRTGAVLDNIFNHLDSSTQKINVLLKDYDKQLTDSARYGLLNIQQANYAKLYEYAKADQAISEMLDKYSRLAKKEEVADYENTRIIWRALSGQPKQEVAIADDTKMQMQRDKAGLSLLEVSNDSVSIGFIFDTGANLSTVTQTTANKFHMRFMTGVVDVTAITGIKIKSKIAVCPVLRMGNITIRNAVFLVFPDSALAIPQIGLQINGIIGLPVIEALKEIQLTKNGGFNVPARSTVYPERNLALDFLTPVINLDGESYSFDSGADASMLYEPYYGRHKKQIESAYLETDLGLGGAGGHITKKGYYIQFTPTINGRRVVIDSVMLFKEVLNKDEEYPFAGNIGQDLIRKFDKMTINFDSMFVKFE
ncbi:MAG TPA: retropepsin-like aspartic protease [Chitinophagaceae bacterium]|nr:retropepsin-like aspartic protease [Chitinophagaceae bacterium]